MERTKLYFASDFHLGVPNYQQSREREEQLVSWLDAIKNDASEVFLVGDIFDFWFEYVAVIPKGFIRLQGKLAELSDAGIKLYFFKGNHDMWVFDYFKKEFNLQVVDNELIIDRNGKRFFIHHGDGLGSGDISYKILKKFFRSGFCQWLFARIHPNLGIGIANYWSSRSRLASHKNEWKPTEQEEKYWVSEMYHQIKQQYGAFDYLIMGHRHHPFSFLLDDGVQYVNLGEWVNASFYAVYDGVVLELKKW